MNKKQIPIKQKALSSPANDEALKKLKIYLGIIIAAFAFLLYVQSIHFNYTLDDHPAIDQNKITTKGIAGIPTLLKTDYWYGYKDEVRGPVYRPASLIIFAIVWQFSPDSPHIYHFINVLFYAITCLVLFIVLCKLFEKKNLVFPFVCSLLYAAHPIHTEVVNNIKSLDEILCFLFGILSLLLILKYVSKGLIMPLILGLLSFFLSLISKETGITFLIIIPLALFFFTDIKRKKLAALSFGMLAVSIVYFLIKIPIFKDVNMNVTNSVLNNTLVTAPDIISREATAFYILLRYILLLIVPHPLTCDYNFSVIKIQSLSDLPALLGILVVSGIFIYSIINFRKKNVISFSILLFLITVAPVSNVFLLIGSTMAERFMYIPSLGFCIISTYLLIKLTKTESLKSKFNNLSQFFSINSLLFIIVFGIVILYSIKTISRSADWKDNYTIFNHDAEVSDNSATAHFNVGCELMINLMEKEKNPQIRNDYNERAIKEFNKAISIYPNYSEFYFKLSNCYYIKGDYQNALLIYHKAMQFDNKLNAKLFRDLASIYDKTNQFDKEISVLDSAIKYAPDSADIHNDKGCAYFSLKMFNDAIDEYQKAIYLNPKSAMAYKNMGSSFINLGHYQQALESLLKSASIDSSDDETFKFIGMIYQATGDAVKGKLYLEKASDLSNRSK